jgi:DNA-binding MarR family transcriptional regulator
LHNANVPKRNHQGDVAGEILVPRLEASARELVGHLDRAMRRLVLAAPPARTLAAMERFSRSEIAVVDTLGAEGTMPIGELAARVRMPLSTATRVVDRLVARDMLRRERLEQNRRVVRVALARRGRCFYRAALGGRIAGMRQMLGPLSEGEQRELIRLFQKIADSTDVEFER